MKKNTSLLLHSVQASCTVNSDFPYTGLNTENHIGTENAFINYSRCQLQKFVVNKYNDIFGAFIITANVENLVYGFII